MAFSVLYAHVISVTRLFSFDFSLPVFIKYVKTEVLSSFWQ